MKKFLYEDLYKLEETHWWHKSKRTIVTDLLKKNLNSKNLRILDIGCGTGRNLQALSELGSVWGIDNSKDAIMYCKKRGFKNAILGDAHNTKLKANSFDAITLLDVLEHTDHNKTLQEVYRLLKPHGLVVITVPAYKKLWSQWDVVLHHKRRYTKKNLSEVLQKNFFSVKKISYLYSFLVAPVYVIRLIKSKISSKNYSSDFTINSNIVNTLFSKIASFEAFFAKNFTVPFGTSIICVAVKKESSSQLQKRNTRTHEKQ
jgi:ubiquinone/menaquinone biosynthesis C-methylase UbiE